MAKNGELAPWADGTTLRGASITTMEPTKIRSNNQSSRPAHRVAKTCVDKRPADRVAVLLRKALAARHLVPRTAHLLFHIAAGAQEHRPAVGCGREHDRTADLHGRTGLRHCLPAGLRHPRPTQGQDACLRARRAYRPRGDISGAMAVEPLSITEAASSWISSQPIFSRAERHFATVGRRWKKPTNARSLPSFRAIACI
jgi:hypothetical protein